MIEQKTGRSAGTKKERTGIRMPLLAELKRRRVFRVAAVYVVGTWLALQVSDVLFPGWGIPEEAIRFVVYTAVAGFPIALVFGWKYDITTDGLVRTSKLTAQQARSQSLSRRDFLLLSLLLVSFIGVSWGILQRVTEIQDSQSHSVTGQQLNIDPGAVAILPFSELGSDENAILAAGLHEDLITRVIKLADLSVISETSLEIYRASEKPLGVIARELGVGRVLTGTVQRSGDRVRVNIRLVDTVNDRNLWGEAYDRVLDADNLFEIQADIAERVALALEAEVTPQEAQRLEIKPTTSFEAYQALLRGKLAARSLNPESQQTALEHYRRALQIEPHFAQAYLGMAEVYVQQLEFLGLPQEEGQQKAIEYVQKAIELDGSLGDAYRIWGARVRDQGNYPAALGILMRGLEVEPGNGRLHHVVGLTLRMQGRAKEAMPYYDRALQLDPLSPIVNESRGSALRDVGRFDEAERQYQLTMKLDPELSTTYWGIGTLKWSQGLPADAASWFRQARMRAPHSDAFAAMEALMFLEMGLDQRAEILLKTARQQQAKVKPNGLLLPAQYLAIYRGTLPQEIPNLRKLTPEFWYGGAISLPNESFLTGEYPAALEILQREFPGLVSVGGTLDGTNFREAIQLAYVLDRLGDRIASRRLLTETEAWIADKPRLGIRGYWVTDAQIHAIRGDHTAAITALQTAVDEGWRNLWRYFFEHDPVLRVLHEDPEYRALASRVRAEMTRQAVSLVALPD